jgi:hypothetical protein
MRNSCDLSHCPFLSHTVQTIESISHAKSAALCICHGIARKMDLPGYDIILEFFDDSIEQFLQLWSSDEEEEPKKHGGSVPGKKPNKSRQPDKRYEHLMAQYFNEDRIYDATDFRRRFRRSERLFDRVYKGVLQTDPAYFEQRPDCTGNMGIHPLLKIVAALRVLAYAAPADSVDDNLEIGESTLHETLRHFVDAVSACFGDQYLRAPTTQDVTDLLAQNAVRGFVGMLFSLDCMHWEWQNCPVSMAGQYKGKGKKKPTMVLEACADATCGYGTLVLGGRVH